MCRALALSSGASKGAFQAGAISGLISDGGVDNFQWDVVSGVSVGAINAAAMALYGADDTKKMSTDMVYWWQNLKNE